MANTFILSNYRIYCNNESDLNKYETLFKKLFDAENGGKLDKKRAAKAKEYLLNLPWCGRFGAAEELLQARKRQKKQKMSPSNKKDNTVVFIVNGKRESRNMESKENGGRITDALQAADGWVQGDISKYIAYTLRIPVPMTPKKKAALIAEGKEIPMRILPTKLIPMGIFLARVQEFGAYKDATDANGKVNGVQIQPTNKALYEWLESWPVNYDREWTYEDWEFEGLN